MLKNTKGISMILVGVIIAVIAVGGIIVYKAGQNSSQVIYDENWPPQDLTVIEEPDLSFLDGENEAGQIVDPYDPLAEEEEECLVVTNISAGDTVSFPLEINGTIGYRCWGIFEGEAGFAHIEQDGQMLSQPSVNSGLVRMTSGYYMQSDYPADFSATIPTINGGVSGPANLVITERGDLGENGNPNPDQVIIPINLGSGLEGSQIPPLTQTEAEMLVNELWAECFPGECTGPEVTIEIFDQETFVTAIYGLYSDSQMNEKREGGAFYQNGSWTLANPSVTWNCHPGRGHQDYSTENCI